MTTGEKYGFEVQPAGADSDAVKHYCADHLAFYGYPVNITPSSTLWFGICRAGQVWGVVGVVPVNEKFLRFDDFYFHRSRWGTLAAYAALEAIRGFADATGVQVVTYTPAWNTKMHRAMERVFSVDGPKDLGYSYTPPEKI